MNTNKDLAHSNEPAPALTPANAVPAVPKHTSNIGSVAVDNNPIRLRQKELLRQNKNRAGADEAKDTDYTPQGMNYGRLDNRTDPLLIFRSNEDTTKPLSDPSQPEYLQCPVKMICRWSTTFYTVVVYNGPYTSTRKSYYDPFKTDKHGRRGKKYMKCHAVYMHQARKGKYFGNTDPETFEKAKKLSEEEYWEAICVFVKYVQSGDEEAGVKSVFEKQFTAKEVSNLLVVAEFLLARQEFKYAVKEQAVVEDYINAFVEEGCCCGSQ
ncbi:hypothetical protein BDZ45DRAFT_751706 [Acephala macrosclerotiorum]|nr:hypothetical protein BDZ45DRAFT_751706 [Acephala macrosclerotiorum]